ncbi:MFS transporter [Oceanicoccus sp. KOV_DT_Chl]|uniref:MFS transporter n=1 Tax=Oceanicoccus sp. KOV_DT_Chl TaxID=1904639 RepID=UPI000C7CE5A0|nr:MFS transporter [Oceanicoccus sp. KOV_DT_Chl]
MLANMLMVYGLVLMMEKSTSAYFNRNVLLLTLVQALAMSISPALIFIGAIIGGQLAPTPEWATLPIAVMVIGTALAVYPVVSMMQHFGRQRVFIAALMLMAASCGLIVLALQWRSFVLFCTAVILIGCSLAAIQQIRFAAMESVPNQQKPTAASMIMLAGVVAAFLGPEVMVRGQSLAAVNFVGSFGLLSLCFVIAAAILLNYRQPSAPTSTAQPVASATLPQLFSHPLFVVALTGAGVGFLLMSFVMTATPVSMHDHNGHSLSDTKWVIQSHVSAMFLPSLVLPLLINRFGIATMMVMGLGCYAIMVVVGLSGVGVLNYWIALIFLGIGWNFLFVSATSLLPQTHKPEQQYKAQAVNDTAVFSMQAIAALSSGVVLNYWGWEFLLWTCVPVIVGQLILIKICYQRMAAINKAVN